MAADTTLSNESPDASDGIRGGRRLQLCHNELERLQVISSPVAAAMEHRFHFAVERQHDAATAVTAPPFPKWVA